MSYDPYDDDPARQPDPPDHRADVALAERDRREEQGSTAPRDLPLRFWMRVTNGGRGPCHFESNGDCDGRIEGHHLVPKARIKRELGKGSLVVWDSRNGLPLCNRHHQLVTNRRLAVERTALPPDVEDFAREHGFGWSLDRDYGPPDTPPVKRTDCPCGAEVVWVRLGADDLALEIDEVVPTHPCPDCSYGEVRGKGGRRLKCARCKGRGRLGQPLEDGLVALDSDGRTRLVGPRAKLRPGEAVHRLHECAESVAA